MSDRPLNWNHHLFTSPFLVYITKSMVWAYSGHYPQLISKLENDEDVSSQARSLLEDLVDKEHYSFHALTFNLTTIYELSSSSSLVPRSRSSSAGRGEEASNVSPATGASNAHDLKVNLAKRVATTVVETARKDDGGQGTYPVGWEATNPSYKL